MTEGWHVTAQDISQWTNTNRRQAQDTLPRLVRKLALASINLSLLSFPSGDSVLESGWDGVLIAEKGNAFVSAGVNVFEFGTSRSIHKKANDDYQKRTSNPQGVNRKKTTFVFVTSQIWTKRDNWEREKNSESQWAQVKGLNANDLETWLDQCPAIHRWFARLIGKRPEGAWDIEQAWNSWSYATQLACNADLVIAGRQNQANDLVNQLKANPSIIRVLGESEEEAYAFALAVIKKYMEFSSRLLVVKEPNDWDILIDSQQPLILIPQFENSHSLGLATQRGHWVILPTSKMQLGGRQTGITLRKADRDKQISALVAMGLEEDIAKDVVHSCRGYLNPIRRHPALAPVDYQQPDWATSEHAGPLIAALLGGAWIADNKNDCDKLAQLADVPYDQFEQGLHRWKITNDLPIRRVGNVWQIVSRQDAWSLLCRFVNARVLERFGEVVKEVLQEIDPRFELPPEERWMANVHGKVTRHSSLLRHGLAETLAILASYGDRDCQNIGIHSVQDQVSYWVRQLLMDDMSGQRWGSLARELPLLAEAAPEVFMEAVETGLQGDNPPVMELFVEEGDMGGCPHAGLLWALECISWNLEYLARVVRILAKLARLDPGGRYTNRPFNTIREIFQGCLPQTKAPLNERLKIIDSLIRFEPESGWKLLLDLLPERVGGISTSIHRPHFQDWDEGWTKDVTYKEYYQHTVAIAERILKHVDEEYNTRWLEIIKKLPQLPKESFYAAVIQLRCDLGELTDTAANEIHNELREIISRHREFSDAKWALPKESVDQLDEIYQSLIPFDLITRYKFLFDTQLPNLPDPKPHLDYEQKQKLIEQARIDALEEIWGALQASGIECLAAVAKLPWSVGNSLGNSSFTNKTEGLVLSWLDNENSSLVQTAQAYVSARYRQNHEWLAPIREQYTGIWPDKIWATFCLGLPFNKAVFDFLEPLADGVKKHYWENVWRYYLQNEDAKYANWVIEKLLAHKRPLGAINAAACYLHTIARETDLDGALLARALELAATNPADQDTTPLSSISYDIIKVLKELQSNPDIDERRLAHIEWMYVRIFRHNGIQPVALLEEVLKNPSFFVHLICLVFKAKPPIEEEFSDLSPELRKRQSENAWYLLELVDQLPGQNANQEVNAVQLQEWIEKVREGCAKRNRRAIGDEYIGKLLSHSPSGSDGIWPHEAVRDIIEQYERRNIEEAIEVGLFNQRGVTSRALGEGGKQERELADKYQQQADEIKYRWPRTAAMLGRIADSYKHFAAKLDLEDELEY
jgi:hypothetical protein